MLSWAFFILGRGVLFDDKHRYDQETHRDKDSAIGDIEDGKTLHDEVREVHIDEVCHSAKDYSIREIADRTAHHQAKGDYLNAVVLSINR